MSELCGAFENRHLPGFELFHIAARLVVSVKMAWQTPARLIAPPWILLLCYRIEDYLSRPVGGPAGAADQPQK